MQDLSERFKVTAMTIRRDLEALERRSSIQRTHGGAILSRRSVAEFEFMERSRTRLEAKKAIALEAALLVKPGMSVMLDTGTTTLEVAKAIRGIEDIKVLTSSLAIASVLHGQSNIELVLLGGDVRRNSPDLSGPLTEENLRHFRVELAILGADAADRRGVYASDLGVSRVSMAMMESADHTTLVLDSGKFSRSSFVRFAGWKDFHYVVTDENISRTHRKWLTQTARHARYVRVTKAGRNLKAEQR
ncbi:MAG: DeoR family transcriptional regulator [Candidatus Hydrogenedentota bacterium]